MKILLPSPVHCNCTNKKPIRIDKDILDSIADYTDTMENYFFRKNFQEDVLYLHFKQFPLPSLPIDPFSMNYFVFGIDANYFYSPFVLSKLCEVLDVKIAPEKFYGEDFITSLENNNENSLSNQYYLLKKSDDYSLYEENLANYYTFIEKNNETSKIFVTIHRVLTDKDSKALVFYKGSEYLKHQTAQLLHELNLIFFTYEFKLIQQFRGKEKSRTELANLQRKYIFTDWGLIFPYVFPQNNFSILEDQKDLRKWKFDR